MCVQDTYCCQVPGWGGLPEERRSPCALWQKIIVTVAKGEGCLIFHNIPNRGSTTFCCSSRNFKQHVFGLALLCYGSSYVVGIALSVVVGVGRHQVHRQVLHVVHLCPSR